MLRFAIAALAALGLLLGSTSIADAASVTSCSTTISDKTIDGDLVVPDGKTCDLENVTVTGNVHVGHRAYFFAQFSSTGSTAILGNVVAVQCHFVITAGSLFVGGNVQIEECTGPSPSAIGRATISGNFACEFNPQGCEAVDSTIGGNMQINKNDLATVTNNYVGGNLQCVGNPSGGLTVSGNTVAGNKQGQCAGSNQ